MQFTSKSGRHFTAVFCHSNRFTLLPNVETKFELNETKKALTADYRLESFFKALGLKQQNKTNHVTIEIDESVYSALYAIVVKEKEAKEAIEAARVALLPKTTVVTFDGFNNDGYFIDQSIQIVVLKKEGEKWYNHEVLFSSKDYTLGQVDVSKMPNPIELGYNPNIPASEVTQEQADAIIAESKAITAEKERIANEKKVVKNAARQVIFDKAKETGEPQILDTGMAIQSHGESETYHYSTTYAMPDGTTSTKGSSVEMS